MVLNRAAHQAREAKNYAKLRDTLAGLRLLLPGNPTILYDLAAADAYLGQPERSLAELNALAGADPHYHDEFPGYPNRGNSAQDFGHLSFNPRQTKISCRELLFTTPYRLRICAASRHDAKRPSRNSRENPIAITVSGGGSPYPRSPYELMRLIAAGSPYRPPHKSTAPAVA
jgi:hypothetical protein